eukprot:TRINITY_DN76201_c0_g1_i1.p1 TRINITY_DN76201_c0_g1~~TRINITY_DN76201_c0_g1_i1.p1  ORF type:complete len:473 (+),score=62.22 TRINITY_DN76201_c0_g1_i1:112-1419(+)
METCGPGLAVSRDDSSARSPCPAATNSRSPSPSPVPAMGSLLSPVTPVSACSSFAVFAKGAGATASPTFDFSPSVASVFGMLPSPSPARRRLSTPANDDSLSAIANDSVATTLAGARPTQLQSSLAVPPQPSWSAEKKTEEKSIEQRDMWCLDDFELGPRLGAGTFGHVQLARERNTGTLAVLKIMQKRRIERFHMQRHIAHEIQVQGHLRHPGVTRLYGFFWDQSKIFMILEHAPFGDLQGVLSKQPTGSLEESEAQKHIAQVVDAVAYCHDRHVIHRDIKPQNILVGRGGRLKLADFGWAVHSPPSERRWTLCGTLDYLPPEMVHVTDGHSFGVDRWSLGILTYELLIGQPPFVARVREDTYQLILAAKPEFPEERDAGGKAQRPSASGKDFVMRLVRRDPADRMTPHQATAHTWLRDEDTTVQEAAIVAAGA